MTPIPSHPGAERIAAERQRQIEVEGYDLEGDRLQGEALAAAAACYATPEKDRDLFPALWPWDWEAWKPTDRIRDLEKAGALIAAAIDALLEAKP